MISDYVPENPAEELFELVGKIKAFAAYVNHTNFNVEREICADMLGFKLVNREGEKNEALPVYSIHKTSENVPEGKRVKGDIKECNNRYDMDANDFEIPFTRDELKK